MNEITEIKNDLKEIKDALIGSDLNPNGFMSRLDEVEKYQNKDKKQKWVALGGLLTVGGVGKFWEQIMEIFK